MTITTTTYRDTEYKVCNGTYYHRDTPDGVITALENARLSGTRLHLHYGDAGTGLDWDEENLNGTIGRSTGPVKCALRIAKRNSLGGDSILTQHIVKIRTTTGQLLWKHDRYHALPLQIQPCSLLGMTAEVLRDGVVYTRFQNQAAAEKFIRRLRA